MKRLTTIFHFTFTLVFSTLFFTSTYVTAEDRIILTVKHLPDYTPENSAIYLVTSYNNWEPSDEKFQLKKNKNDEYFIEIPWRDQPFQYKFTRGSWETVEGNDIGEIKQNRWFDPEGPENIDVVILSWQDMAKKYLNRVKVVVTSVPESTPYDATLYLAGDFNNWNPRDHESKMSLQPDGTYTLTLPLGLHEFDYKVTRGSWESVEGRANGRAIINRHVNIKEEGWRYDIKVKSWEDLSGNTMTPYMFLLLLGAFQGIVLILSMFGIQANNRAANVVLATLIFITSVALISKVGMYYRDFFQQLPKMYLMPELILFLYGPIFYLYINQLIVTESVSSKDYFKGLAPFFIQLTVYSPLLAMPKDDFIDAIVNYDLNWIFKVVGGLGLIFNAYYWWKCRHVLLQQERNSVEVLSEDRNLNYLNGVMTVYAACLCIWVILYVVGGIGEMLSMDTLPLVELLTDTLWLIIACISFVMGYYAMNQPEILRVSEVLSLDKLPIKENTTEEVKPEKKAEGLTPELIEIKDALAEEMKTKYLYTNPRLTLPDLARTLNTNTHDLSKVINEGYNKNFYDYINGYRVEAFVKEVLSDEAQELTYLGHAYNVGFNSKTAFNRAFKKETGKTPTQYFNQKTTYSPVSK
ncbi:MULTISPECIES: helix-turn-helix domain-containing protein [Flammeovirga]|uniref:Helix-turn-helix domain-containing protein n=1 Tax=Flammeovirga agarivorans TaxID=2726742 RepID=A0A7X8SJK2_9BACT|nr:MULTISPECIES: helix-turn-helix domain-containing protein [Flammeovirga]NLR91297.1 helix-turn-helix domain-containing protein [Flammeovirga agarivorans]